MKICEKAFIFLAWLGCQCSVYCLHYWSLPVGTPLWGAQTSMLWLRSPAHPLWLRKYRHQSVKTFMCTCVLVRQWSLLTKGHTSPYLLADFCGNRGQWGSKRSFHQTNVWISAQYEFTQGVLLPFTRHWIRWASVNEHTLGLQRRR